MSHLQGRGQQGRGWGTDTLGFIMILFVTFADAAFFSDSSSVLIPCFCHGLLILAVHGDHAHQGGVWLSYPHGFEVP